MTSNYLCKNGSSVLAVYRLASSNGVVPTEEDESFLCIPYIDYFYRSTNYSHCQVIRVLYLIIKFFFFFVSVIFSFCLPFGTSVQAVLEELSKYTDDRSVKTWSKIRYCKSGV